MNILVTGGAGYIGSFAVGKLVDLGHKVVVVDNLCTGHKAAVDSRAEFYLCDISDQKLLSEIVLKHQIDSVMHFAAHTVVPESVTKPEKYYKNNVIGTLKLLEVCVEQKIQNFILSSTAAVYGNPEKVPVVETDRLDPQSPYGKSKMMNEWMVQDMASAYGFRFVVLRYFNVAGAAVDGSLGQYSDSTLLIKVAAQAACGKKSEMIIFGDDYPTHDGTGVRDFIHIEDLIEAHVLSLEYIAQGGKSQILNCGYGRGYSVKETLQMMKQVSGSDFKIRVEKRRLGDLAEVVADNKKIVEVLNWQPRLNDLKIICESSYQWEKSL